MYIEGLFRYRFCSQISSLHSKGGVLATAHWVILRTPRREGAGVVTEAVRIVWAEARTSAAPVGEDCTSTGRRAHV